MLNFSCSIRLGSYSSARFGARIVSALVMSLVFQLSLSAHAAPVSDTENETVVTRCGDDISSPVRIPVAADEAAETLDRLNKNALRSACDLTSMHSAFIVNRELLSVCVRNKKLPELTLKVDSVDLANSPLLVKSGIETIEVTAGQRLRATSPDIAQRI